MDAYDAAEKILRHITDSCPHELVREDLDSYVTSKLLTLLIGCIYALQRSAKENKHPNHAVRDMLANLGQYIVEPNDKQLKKWKTHI